MRQVFSSPRIENAEAVARMLEAEGIEVRLEHGRSFRSSIRGNFSYRDGADNGPKPTVWVIRSEDQPRARQLLRETGLMQAETTLPPSFLPPAMQARPSARDVARDGRRKAMRMRLGLLAAIAIIAAAIVFKPKPDPVAPVTPRVVVQTGLDPSLDILDTAPGSIHLLPTPPALAAAVAALEHGTHGGAVCLGIDGRDPPEAMLSSMRAGGIDTRPASGCDADDPLRVAVYAWRTDGSGIGTVTWSVGRGAGPSRVRSAEASREGDDWHVDTAD